MAYRIRGAELTACRTAVVRAKMPPQAVARWIPGAYRRVSDRLRHQGQLPSGPAFARYTADGDLVEVEAGFPVADAINDDGDVVASGLPGGPAVIVTHIGRLELLDGAYDEAESWLTERGLVAAGAHWETYHTGPATHADPTRWRTDVVIPYSLRPVCSVC